jgi:hypothetical protein
MALVRGLLFAFGILIMYAVINQYFFCPRYSFPEPARFQGRHLFNPYADSDPVQWKRCNFHGHVHAWFGLTHGSGTAEDYHRVYDSLGYDVAAISDYEKINRYGEHRADFMPAYEHGYGIKKNHHGILGTYSVNYGDYVLPQTRHNKQHMLNCLQRNDSAFVILNHPVLRNGFSPEDLRFLTGYDAIEVLRSGTHSFPQWDSALSAGHRAFIAGNDDMHDSSRPNEVGRNCTWVNAPSANRTEILDALRAGNAYGMIIGAKQDESLKQKAERFKQGFPHLHSFVTVNDSIRLVLSRVATSIRFIGQGGIVMEEIQQSDSAAYFFKPEDTYIRTEAHFADGTSIFLNPVFRYDGLSLSSSYKPVVNGTDTLIFRTLGTLLLLIYLLVALRVLRRKSSRVI